MSAHERKKSGLVLFLHLYTGKMCTRKCVTLYPGERQRIYFSKESLQTAFPVEITLWQEGQSFWINDRRICEDNFCILKTGAGEEIMIVLSGRNEKFLSCQKVFLPGKERIEIGNNFRNEVFYDCFSFIRDRHISICKEDDRFLLEICKNETDEKDAGVYINGRAAAAKNVLESGDKIELYGLTMIFLKELLVCTSFYGTLRTAKGWMKPSFRRHAKAEDMIPAGEDIEQAVIEEKQLIAEEVEISLPKPEGRVSSQPVFLTIGPSVTMVIPMLLMAMLGSAMLGGSGAGFYRISVVMTAASAFLSVFWGLVNHFYRKSAGQKDRIRKKEAYLEYLNKTQQYLSDCFSHNKEALLIKYPSCKNILRGANGNGRVYIHKSIRQKDYLFIRLGLGAVPFQVRLKLSGAEKTLNRDRLTEAAYELLEKYRDLTGVPVGIDLGEHRITGFTGEAVYPVFLQALLQLAACHDGNDLKLVYFYHEEEEQEKRIADCIKWLPHIWKSGRKMRYLAGNEKEAGELLPGLQKELAGRQENEKKADCVYLFLLAAKELIKGEGLYRLLMDAKENSGIYVLFLSKKREKLPAECECLVIKDGEREEISCLDQDIQKRQQVVFEKADFPETEQYMRRLSGFSAVSGQREEELPDKVSFLELYSCEKVEDLNCRGRWRENRTRDRIRVPVGIAVGGRLICLDVHEKFHGPHGLVAGTTGSGKSELLQTYLLSLAVSFGPEDINFFIIDYKGGGMGNMLQSLPHCAGVISNLSGRQIRRSLSSIKSENLRRQKLFSDAGVNNVSDYTELYKEGRVFEPIPHLLLVVDEFAELKKEEPEFMQEIISVAQVGRSLGVHLILATQKPAGTVDDKIWSNARFRLCLRVADKQDSMDMLHRPEAAGLTGAGQCYLQVGNNELYELFQAGYGGAEYRADKSMSEGAYMVFNTGKRFSAAGKRNEKYPAQIEAVIAYINRVAGELASKAAKPLWMPELGERLSLPEIADKKEEGEGEIALCFGMCDDPERQRQYSLYYEPLKEGNLVLCGAPAVGKSTFLQTILYQLCRYPADQVRFLLAASDNAGVNCFENMPGCLGNMREKEEAECFFYHLERLFTKRKEELSGINFLQYRRHREDAGAFYFLIIDNYGSFRQMTQDRYEELIERIAGEGQNYGFYLIVTALNVSSGEIPGKLFEKLKVTLSLEMSDRFLYGDVLRQYHISVFPKENIKGRGLCRQSGRILEFQVPLFSLEDDDYERVNEILSFAKERNVQEEQDKMPVKFPSVPLRPVFENMADSYRKQKESADHIPVGYEKKSGYIADIPIRKGFSFLILGADRSGKRNLLYCMIQDLWEKGIITAVFDRRGVIAEQIGRMAIERNAEDLFFPVRSEPEFTGWYDGRKEKKASYRESFLCIGDLADFTAMLSGRSAKMLEIRQEMEQTEEENAMIPVIALLGAGREMETAGTPVYEFMKKHQCGIHLGGNVANQRTLSFDDLSFAQMNQWEKPGTGYLKTGNGSKTKKICVPLYERRTDDTDRYSGAGSEPDV